MQQPLYGGGHPHTPRTPATPNAPGPTGNMPYPQSSQPGGRGGLYQVAPHSQYPPPQGYATSAAMMSQATTASSHQQPLAPSPNPGRGAPILRPMPAGGVMPQQAGLSSPYGPGPAMQQSSGLQEGEPTHVVGSQGRRGVLPSAPGRPQISQVNTKGTAIPQKDADGKFPCPHCTKTYLHAKHLKRHLLRHTGDRPYMCVLCRDTFSRSDILKRHFQKCSLRRGNPEGVSHLSHPGAHVKKNAAAQKNTGGVGNEADINHLNGMGNMPPEGMPHSFSMVPVSDGSGGTQDRRSMTGPVMGASGQSYSGDVPGSLPNPQMQNYNMTPNQNGMSMYGGGSNPNPQSGLDWAQMFQPSGAQNTYAATAFTPNIGQTQIGIKQDSSVDSGRADDISGVTSDSLFFPTYMTATSPDPYLLLSNRILNFFYPPPTSIIPNHSAGVTLYFSPENIRDFLDKYTHFHVHFPMIHTPTFRIMEAHTGLLVGLCCIGACYSDRVSPYHVREMMDFLKMALERDVRLVSLSPGHCHLPINLPQSLTKRDIEELQAVTVMLILHLWNGTREHRDYARKMYSVLSICVRNLGLLRVAPPGSPLYSPLHQPDFSPQNFDVSTFNWDIWIEQERRVRLMHITFVGDSAMALYFNMSPQFNSLEMTVPLPCDDAAWDARTIRDCAAALGLQGPQAAREQNPNGTQRARQPELSTALRALLHSSSQIQPGSTNLYGKFIIIHAILALIRRVFVDQSASMLSDVGTPPLSDWMVRGADWHQSGHVTPVEGVARQLPKKTLTALCIALEKFKSNWDVDMVVQFPPSAAARNPRRHGFSRDGIHFYWLAKYMLKHTRRTDLQLAADLRFSRVMHLLISVKAWVMTDGASRGEELGSIGEIDKDYGVADTTLNLADLFKPLPKVVDDPRITSVKTEFDSC